MFKVALTQPNVRHSGHYFSMLQLKTDVSDGHHWTLDLKTALLDLWKGEKYFPSPM